MAYHRIMQRAALVIGVRKTGGLAPLEGAIAGANRISTWLSSKEGFDVFPVTDEREPVTVTRLFDAVSRIVDAMKYEQLVVYFAGHGFSQAYSEYWLLSGAPRNPNEAVVLEENVRLARGAGIPSVVFISDACRSTVASLQAQRVRGGVIFPGDPPAADTDVRVDRFFATEIGDAAFEIPVVNGQSTYEAVYTQCFRKAFNSPPPEMRRTVTLAGKPIEVVPNRRLVALLRDAVPTALKGKSVKAQRPDAHIESDDDVFIGRVWTTRGDLKVAPTLEPAPAEVSRYLFGLASASPAQAKVLERVSERLFDLQDPDDHERAYDLSIAGKTIIQVFGASVAWAVGLGCSVRSDGSTVEVRHEQPIASVLLGFVGGTGTCVAALEHHASTLRVTDGRVRQVSYVQLSSSAVPPAREELERLARLRQLATQASRSGIFRIETRAEAEQLAGKIREMKRIDPTLGLYAAYAYAASGNLSQLQDMRAYLEYDLRGIFYDIALLAGAEPDWLRDRAVAPFMPMLRQGWPLMRGLRGVIPPAAERASEHLLDALWTTFDARGMDILRAAVEAGELS
jgi:hypothetical protein